MTSASHKALGLAYYQHVVVEGWFEEIPHDIAVAQVEPDGGPYEFGAVVLLAVPVRGTRGGIAERRTRDSGESTFDPDGEVYMVVAGTA
jgi:hypothetical protein